MKKVLFLPFLNIPSGHHQAADSIAEELTRLDPAISTEKIELLNYTFGFLESLISKVYLKWIHYFPSTYSALYRMFVVKESKIGQKNGTLYEWIFLNTIRKLITIKKPDLVICTHALPSYLLNKLKKQKRITVPIANVYTDFFIHRLWGVDAIDYHFVSHQYMAEYLIQQGVKQEKIFVTGIPTHKKILPKREMKFDIHKKNFSCLVMGGSLGVGKIKKLITKLKNCRHITFHVLCGTNNMLYSQLRRMKVNNIIPYPYIHSKEKMDELYNQVDFIITKPGGVTMSEILIKRKPSFVYHALPGQEEINLEQLLQLGVVFPLSNWEEEKDLEKQLLYPITNQTVLTSFQKAIDDYHNIRLNIHPSEIIHQILLKMRRLPMKEKETTQQTQYVHVPETGEILACNTYSGKELFWKELKTIVEDGGKEK
jgi:processive 1,2-diacylglycerol beta-glucosyltransferase